MNRQRLKNYKYLKKEIKSLEKRIRKLKEKHVETDFVVGSETAIPYRQKTYTVQGVRDNSLLIYKNERILEERKSEALSEKLEIEKWIASLFDTRLRLIFDLRYMQDKSWLEISLQLGYRDESTSRKAHDRYLDEVENENK